jgi:acetoin utilization deacetylase AcuC-like enzyme
MVVEGASDISPSAGKPALVVASWEKLGLPVEIMPFEPLSLRAISMAHNAQFVRDVMTSRTQNGFLNSSQAVAESLPWTNGSFYAAADHAVRHDENTVSPTSGFHHACYAEAMGFCTFNGLMVAAAILHQESKVAHVGIVDFDAHWGNGTDDIMKRLEIDFVQHYSLQRESLHRHPERFLQMLPDLLQIFRLNDVIFYQAGADPHVDDPFGEMKFTTAQLAERDRIVFETFRRLEIPVVWNLAGGYQTPIEKVLEIHDNTAKAHVAVFG